MRRGIRAFFDIQGILKKYVDVCREKQATPILVTPVHRRYFDSKGLLEDTHGDYITAVRELAEEENIPWSIWRR